MIAKMPRDLAKNIKAIRKQMKLSQYSLAMLANISPTAVCNFERMRTLPSLETIRRLADALGVTTDYLLGRETAPNGAGPLAKKIIHNLGLMSPEDQEFTAKITTIMSQKNRSKKPKDSNT